MLRFFLTLLVWLLLVAVAALSSAVLVPVWLLTWPFDRNRVVCGTIFRRAARLVGQLSPLWHFEALAPYPARLTRAHVVISNHQSHLDAFLICSLPYEMKWLAKRSLFFIPFIGWAMALAGDIAIVRTKGPSIGQALSRCRKVLSRGMSVFIFPEGTRGTQVDYLLPLKDGAFRLALEAEAPILPLGVAGTRDALPKGAWRFDTAYAAVAVGAPIETAPIIARHRKDGALNWSAAISELKAISEQAIYTQIKRAQAARQRKLKST